MPTTLSWLPTSHTENTKPCKCLHDQVPWTPPDLSSTIPQHLTPPATTFGFFTLQDHNTSGLLYWQFLLWEYSCPIEPYGQHLYQHQVCVHVSPSQWSLPILPACSPCPILALWAPSHWPTHFFPWNLLPLTLCLLYHLCIFFLPLLEYKLHRGRISVLFTFSFSHWCILIA